MLKISRTFDIHPLSKEANLYQFVSSNQELLFPTLAKQSLYFDIETTGLGHYNKLIIIGLVYLTTDGSAELIQLFNDDGHSELQMLKTFISIIESHDFEYLISYNGDAFDIPFLNARFKHHQLNYVIDKALNFDLLKWARKYKSLISIDSLSLKHIERFLGISREDTISGKESIDLYYNYLNLKSQDAVNAERLKSKILKHNDNDLINMVPLTYLLYLDKTSYWLTSLTKPYIIAQEKWLLTSLQVTKKGQLEIEFTKHFNAQELDIKKFGQGIVFEKQKNHLSLSVSIVTADGPNGQLTLIHSLKILGKSFDLLSSNEQHQCLIKIDAHWQVDCLRSWIIGWLDFYYN